MAIIARARPFRGTGRHGPACGKGLCPGPLALHGIYAKPHWEHSLVPLVFRLGEPLAVGWLLRVKLRWLGPPLSTRVLLLFPSLLSLASCQGGRCWELFCNLSLSLLSLDRSIDVGTELSFRAVSGQKKQQNGTQA